MKELQKQLADNTPMSAVLCLQEERTGEQGGGLKTALQCASASLILSPPSLHCAHECRTAAAGRVASPSHSLLATCDRASRAPS